MSTPEQLFDCPKCGRTKFTAKGLKAHACKPEVITTEPETMLAPILPKPLLISTFTTLQDGIKGDVLAMKVKMFFAGMLVKELADNFRATVGETRGRPEKTDGASVLNSMTLESYLEDCFNVTARTCHRYRRFWEDCTSSDRNEKAVKALNLVWTNHLQTLQLEAPKKPGKGKGKAKASQPLELSLHAPSKSFAEDVQELLTEADELGLHELFEVPLKEVGPAGEDNPEPPEPPDNKGKLIKFWITDFGRRLTRKEYMRLPKAQRETLATDWEIALHELKDSLATSRKKGKA